MEDSVRQMIARWRQIVAGALVGGALACAYYFLAAPTYESRMSLVPVNHVSRLADGSGASVSALLGPSFDERAHAARLVAILESRSVLDAIITGRDLVRHYGTRDIEHARASLLARCSFELDKLANVVSVICRDKSARLARDITSDFARVAAAVYRRVDDTATTEERQFLDRRIVEAQIELETASDALSAFERAHHVADAIEQGRMVVGQLSGLWRQRNAFDLQLSYRRTFAASGEATVLQLRRRIEALDAELAKRIGSSSSSATEAAFPPAMALPRVGRELEELYMRRDLAESTYLALEERRARSAADAIADTSAFEVLDSPMTANEPVAPRGRVIALGLVLGAVLAALGALLWPWWRGLPARLREHPVIATRRALYELAVLLSFTVTMPLGTKLGLWMTLSEVVALPAACVLVVEALRSAAIRAQWARLYDENRFVFWYVAWALVASLLGLARSADSLKAFRDLVPGIVLFALVGFTVNSVDKLRGIIGAAVIGLSLHLVLAIPQALFGAPYLVATHEGFDEKMNLAGEAVANSPVGLFVHPNGLGLFLMPMTLFAIAAVRWAGRRARPALYMLLAVDAWVLIAAHVKGVYAFLAIGIVLVLLPVRWERSRKWLPLALPVAGIFAVTWYSIARFLAGEAAFGTMITRIQLWDRAVDLIRTDTATKLVGNGYPLFDTSDLAFVYPNAHNAWLNHILSFGIPGLLLYLGCFATSIRAVSHGVRRATAGLRALLVATGASLAALLGESFFEPCDRGDVFPAQVFLLFALAVVLRREVTDA